MINSVTIAGYIGKEPEMNIYGEAVKVTFSIAVNTVIKGEEKTSWIPVECWGNQASFVGNYLHSGSYVIVQGKLEQSVWETDEGEKKSRLFVYANHIESPKQGNREQGTGNGVKGGKKGK
ncbi:single-stranded DNA-binding protein [Cyanobacterium aponinum AL20118]|uniref:Single-stranded DNA-binding protein n=1 Tax=Cyanobacterium aponinum AL20115 TaxID=3090662 RepID=A0AAF1C167_9CHRO|nr:MULTISPECIES: single-stranded DNA-binding protein [Cyanobacterium]WPF87338.1 single-stranded DNA-binding protein [Cyanobacterium aponinum AL20115]WVL00473.1 single-stranded DNA-binding protein [Cyanobacterium sp. Dongsha4]